MVLDRSYAGAAVETTVTSSMSPSSPGNGGTFTVADATGYPDTGAFVVVIDRGESNEEKIEVSSRSGTTFTVATRGFDDTVASTHTINEATCKHPLDAAFANSTVDHIDDNEADPHSTKLLNIIRHDVVARHQFGSGLAFGVPGTPTALTPDIAGAAGSGNNPSREDHAHNVPAAAAVSITGSNTEGANATFARSDHTHAYGANSLPLTAIPDGLITAAKLASEAGTSYTPTLTNVTLGGGVRFGRYFKLGRLVFGVAGFELGASGNVTGLIQISIPFAAEDVSAITTITDTGWICAARARDDSANAVFPGIGLVRVDTSIGNFVAAGASADWGTGDAPFNWAPNDVLMSFFAYEATS